MDQHGVQAVTAPTQATDIQHVFDLCAGEVSSIDSLIRESLESNVVLIRQIAEYIIGSGGKRLRPLLVVLAARACDYQGQDHIAVAAIIEFIHTATLLHDVPVKAKSRASASASSPCASASPAFFCSSSSCLIWTF